MWCLWGERNARCFEDLKRTLEELKSFFFFFFSFYLDSCSFFLFFIVLFYYISVLLYISCVLGLRTSMPFDIYITYQKKKKSRVSTATMFLDSEPEQLCSYSFLGIIFVFLTHILVTWENPSIGTINMMISQNQHHFYHFRKCEINKPYIIITPYSSIRSVRNSVSATTEVEG